MSIRVVFNTFKAEAELIGRLLAGYSELELSMAQCVNVAGNDPDTTFKALFRCRGELARIQIADALGRQKFGALGLGTQFEMTIGAMQHCRQIRNQFAHCTWWGDLNGNLGFTNLEEIAASNAPIEDLSGLTRFIIDVPLLLEQEAYFDNTEGWWSWLIHETHKKVHGRPSPYTSAPKHVKQPPLHSGT